MEPPVKPDPSDCCNSGCNPCILDIYEEQLKKYETRNSLKNKSKGFENHINCLSLTSYNIFTLEEIEHHTQDTYFYTFKYNNTDKIEQPHSKSKKDGIFYKPGQYFLIKAQCEMDHFTSRAYTPIPIKNTDSMLEFTVLVKLYEHGAMSRFLKNLKIGAKTLWRGPYGNYKGDYNKKYILFIAQGTGIAPIYAIIKDMIANKECYTFLTLFFCCESENVLLHNEIFKLTENWNFKYELYINKKSENSFVGKYNEVFHFKLLGQEEIKKYLLEKVNVKVLICGQGSFSENMKNWVFECGILENDVFVF